MKNLSKFRIRLPKADPNTTSCTPIQSPLFNKPQTQNQLFRPQNIDVRKLFGRAPIGTEEPKSFFSSR